MDRPVLYLMLGYPGAGKTTVAKLISQKTGAVHLWADDERHKMFAQPTHSEAESLELYEHLNDVVKNMLAEGQSVVFDTNFNHYHDREMLHELAAKQGADTKLIWLTTPAAVARDRAVHANIVRNGYQFAMTGEEFDAIAHKFEPPREDEKAIKIDGVKLDASELLRLI